MKSPRILFYRLDLRHLPKGADACARQALKRWEKALGGGLRFVEDVDLADWHFMAGEHPSFPEKVARCIHVTTAMKSLVFDPREKWRVTWWQRWTGHAADSDLLVLMVHEIGHALGIDKHSAHADSVMHSNPFTTWIDPAYVAIVKAKQNL